MFIGNVKHDTTITKIKLSCVSFAPHSRIFSVVVSSISTARDSQNDSPKLIMNSVFLTTLRLHESVAVMIRCTDFFAVYRIGGIWWDVGKKYEFIDAFVEEKADTRGKKERREGSMFMLEIA